MLETYAGVLRGDRIEWTGDAPEKLPPDRTVRVHVTLLDKAERRPPAADQGRRMAEALEQLAAHGGLKAIPDPEEWQREARQDRPLPGRDD